MKNLLKTILILAVFFTGRFALAAEIAVEKFLPETNELKVGDEILLNVTLISEGTEYNAIEGMMKVPPIFTIDKVITGSSFISVWLESPTEFKDDTINFSGITPAGYNQEKGSVFSVVLKAVVSGGGSLTLADIAAYKNDGLGTRESIDNSSLLLRVREAREGELPYLIAVKDNTPPTEFSIEIVSNSDLFDGKYALVWNTRDLGSGIAAYDVYEGNRVFKQVNSPYLLENQHLNGKIKVVAYDHEGNMRATEIIPPGKVCVGVDCFSYAKLAVIFSLVVIVLVILCRNSKQ